MANALAFMPSTITGEFRREEYVQANALLDQADQSDPTVEIARRHFNEVKLAPVSPPTKVQLWIARVHDWITGLTERPRFEAVVITLVIMLPVLGSAVLGITMAQRIRKYRRANRAATSRVTGFIGEGGDEVEAQVPGHEKTHGSSASS